MHELTTYEGRQKFYQSKDWQELRAYKLSINPICERCKAKGLVKAATDVHHINDIAKQPELSLVLSNLESLCKSCHSSHTRTEMNRARKDKNLSKLKELAGLK